MSDKTFIVAGENPPLSQVGASLESLAAAIAARRNAGEESYTFRLLSNSVDQVLKKIMEEAGETALAAKDADAALYFAREAQVASPNSHQAFTLSEAADEAVDHLRYEAADVVYHVMVALERFDISLEEFAAELNNRMTADERPFGGVQLHKEHVKRGK